jgi:hypothetical protein
VEASKFSGRRKKEECDGVWETDGGVFVWEKCGKLIGKRRKKKADV